MKQLIVLLPLLSLFMACNAQLTADGQAGPLALLFDKSLEGQWIAGPKQEGGDQIELQFIRNLVTPNFSQLPNCSSDIDYDNNPDWIQWMHLKIDKRVQGYMADRYEYAENRRSHTKCILESEHIGFNANFQTGVITDENGETVYFNMPNTTSLNIRMHELNGHWVGGPVRNDRERPLTVDFKKQSVKPAIDNLEVCDDSVEHDTAYDLYGVSSFYINDVFEFKAWASHRENGHKCLLSGHDNDERKQYRYDEESKTLTIDDDEQEVLEFINPTTIRVVID